MTDFVHAGTVIHGTHRPQDIIPAFMGKLREIDPAWADEIEAQYPVTMTDLEADHFMAATSLIERLTDALEHYAPEGWYFGTLEGDGADFGFWRSEADDDTPECMRPGFDPESIGTLGRWSNDG